MLAENRSHPVDRRTSFPLLGFSVAVSILYEHSKTVKKTAQKQLASEVPHWSPISVAGRKLQKCSVTLVHESLERRRMLWPTTGFGTGILSRLRWVNLASFKVLGPSSLL